MMIRKLGEVGTAIVALGSDMPRMQQRSMKPEI